MASNALLEQIQAGKRLKKATTHDRSAPIVEPPKSSMGGGGGGMLPSGAASAGAGGGMGAGPPQLAGLFAGGMPKLKPAGHNSPGEILLCRSIRKQLISDLHQPKLKRLGSRL